MTVGLAVHKAIFPLRSLRQRERAELRWLVQAFVVITAAVQHQLWLQLHLHEKICYCWPEHGLAYAGKHLVALGWKSAAKSQCLLSIWSFLLAI